MFKVINLKQLVMITLVLSMTLYIFSRIIHEPKINIANSNEGGNDSGGLEVPPPPSPIDQFLKLIIGNSNQSSATRNS